MRIQSAISLIVLFFSSCARADTPPVPYAYVTTSIDGRFYFKMVPDAKNYLQQDSYGSGTLYKVQDSETDKALWTTSGWYAFKTDISHDGKYLVRMGNWPVGNGPSNKDLAISFYEAGKLIKSYSTKDLIKDYSRVPLSVSHYEYLKKVTGFDPYTYRFAFTTIDDIEYTFDVTTGNIIAERQLSRNSVSQPGFAAAIFLTLISSA